MRPDHRFLAAPFLVAGGAVALTGYGLFALRRDLAAEHLRARERARETVRLVAASIGVALGRLGAELGARAPDPAGAEGLEAFAAGQPSAEIAFSLDATGAVRHPPILAPAEADLAPEPERVRVEAWLEEAAFRELAQFDAAGARLAFEQAERAASHPRTRGSVALARAASDLRRGERESGLGRLESLLDRGPEGSSPRARALARLARARLLAEAGDAGAAAADVRALLGDLESAAAPDASAVLAEIEAAGVPLEGDLGEAAARVRGASRREALRGEVAAAARALLAAPSPTVVGNSIAILGAARPEGRVGLLLSPERFLADALPAAARLAPVEGIPIQAASDAARLGEEAEVPGVGGLLRVGLPPGFEPAAPASGARPFLLASLLLLLGATVAGAAWLTARAARREVEAARAKSEFLSAVTHELKTPLASIRLYGELLEDGKGAGEGKRREWVGAIRRESERLSILVDRVLALARRERREEEEPVAVALAGDLVRTAAETFRPVAERAGARLEVVLESGEARLRAEASGIVQAVLDLLDNAVKHGGSEVRLRACREGARYRIEVADRGPGVPPGEEEAIFGMFARGKEAVDGERPGLGVGLALARRIVEANGGTLSLAPREGGGSVFALSLPIEEAT